MSVECLFNLLLKPGNVFEQKYEFRLPCEEPLFEMVRDNMVS